MLYDDASWFYRLMRRLAGTAPLAWYGSWTGRHTDRLAYRLTGSRFTLTQALTGIPVVFLESAGARTGQPRSTPVLGIPDGDNLVVIASNFGRRHQPAWYYNLVAHPEATVTIDGVRRPVRARLAQGEERQRLWELGLRWYPVWPKYESRARSRRFPIFVLEPVNTAPEERDASPATA